MSSHISPLRMSKEILITNYTRRILKRPCCHTAIIRQRTSYDSCGWFYSERGTDIWPITVKKKNNKNSFSKALGHHELPEQLQHIFVIMLVSGTLVEGWNTNLPNDIPSFTVVMMMVEKTVKHVSQKSPIGLQQSWDLVTVKTLAYYLYHFHTQLTI